MPDDEDWPDCNCCQYALTVAELIAQLQQYPADMHVLGRYDCGCGQGAISITTGTDRDWPDGDQHVLIEISE